ncbi:calmodulin-like protein 3 [Canna indica]|uniref:Calmodulin-like protein 3 n=1 Tax=Canna indica TaxID=4628 RepID=A0AAQ3Q1Z8_9LILI|nr:calmodulin-like protein 3 [Canna indica]
MDRLLGGKEEEEMCEEIEVFDHNGNGDGFITVEKLRLVLASFRIKQGRTAEDCNRMTSTVDVDDNGMMDCKRMTRSFVGNQLDYTGATLWSTSDAASAPPLG